MKVKKHNLIKYGLSICCALCMLFSVGQMNDSKRAKAVVSDKFFQEVEDGGGGTTPLKPTLTCPQTTFGSTYGNTFSVWMGGSGTQLYYKTPAMSSYEVTLSKSYTVSTSQSDGKYYFYAMDAEGQSTDIVWIELKITPPSAEVTKYDSLNRYIITWEDDSTGQLNGEPYTSGSWISAEGDYTFVLTNTVGRSTVYTFSIGHSYKAYTTVQSTCTTSGYTIYRCITCYSMYQSNHTSPKGHNYVGMEIAATCTAEGATYTGCTRCGDYYDRVTIPALGHAYEVTTVEAKCMEGGCVRHACTRCDQFYDTDITYALGHLYARYVELVATCTEEGVRGHTCERCGDYYTTPIPMVGHNYAITEQTLHSDTSQRTYTCVSCGHSYTQTLGNQYEAVSDYIEYLFNQYSPYMVWVFIATAGVWSIAMGIAMIVARKNEEKEKAKKMVVNYLIGMIIIFAIIVAAPYLVRGIALLIAG